MDSASLQQFIVLFLFLVLSAFFSMSETALTSLSKITLINMVDQNVKGAKKVESILKDRKKLISTILIGNNVVNIGASVITTSIAIDLAGNNNKATALSAVLLTVIILIFCEITPKVYATQYAEKISILVAGPMEIAIYIMTPLVYIFTIITNGIFKILKTDVNKVKPTMTEDELKSMLIVGHQEGILESKDNEMINNVFGFSNYDAKDVMTPRTDVSSISCNASYDEVKRSFQEDYFSRLPVYRDNIDKIVGILNFKDFIFYNNIDEFNIEDIMREPFFTYESKSTKELFHIMRNNSISIAVILDEYGGTAGIVTIEDLIEEIVGELNDEYDVGEEEIEVIKEDEYVVEGSARIEDVNDMLSINIESEDFDSIGGYVIGLVGHIPNNGQVVQDGEVKFIIEEVDNNRIEKIRIYT